MIEPAQVPASVATRAGSAFPSAASVDGASTNAPVSGSLLDPRLEPMRRVADRVTLRFEGEGGLEGRLRIAMRGETLHASILSSDAGTLEQLGGELGTLRQALREQGFVDSRVAMHDTRAGVNSLAEAKSDSRTAEDRRQGEPSRQKQQGREERPGGQTPSREDGRRSPRQGRRSS